MHYTIGIKYKLLPWYKKYQATAHWCEGLLTQDGGNIEFPVRLAIKSPDGSVTIIHSIASRTWKIYPDYDTFMAQKAVEAPRIAEET